MPDGGAWPSRRRRRIHRSSKGRGRVDVPSVLVEQEAHGIRVSVLHREVEGGIRNYDGSLKEGEGDKELDGVTKNSMGVMRREVKNMTHSVVQETPTVFFPYLVDSTTN